VRRNQQLIQLLHNYFALASNNTQNTVNLQCIDCLYGNIKTITTNTYFLSFSKMWFELVISWIVQNIIFPGDNTPLTTTTISTAMLWVMSSSKKYFLPRPCRSRTPSWSSRTWPWRTWTGRGTRWCLWGRAKWGNPHDPSGTWNMGPWWEHCNEKRFS